MSAYTSSSNRTKKLNVLDKVVKKNPKYAHIESNIDTGSSITRYMKKLEEIKTNYRYQQNEIFKRMKITTFIQLILQIANMDSLHEQFPKQMNNQTSRTNYTERTSKETALATISDNIEVDDDLETDRYSTLHSVINGIGEQDVLHAKEKVHSNFKSTFDKPKESEILPYLLLDIRDKDEYNSCHIISALNYPTAMLSRSINNETKELMAYKNREGKIIVIYDEDEKIAPRAAATLVERGYDNLFMLSGGLKLAFKKFPEGLITGKIPSHLIETTKNISNNILESDKNNQEFFNDDDLEKLNLHLEKALLINDSSSRLSRASTNSERKSTYSTISSMSKVSSLHSQPWKPV